MFSHIDRVRVILPILLLSLLSFGQDIQGTWYEPQYGFTLILSASGTYRMQLPTGTASGHYAAGQGQLQLRNANGYNALSYTIVQLGASVLVLKDANGVTMNFKRKSEPVKSVQSAVVPDRKIPLRARRPVQKIASRGNRELTTSDIDDVVELVQFVVGHGITRSDVKELEAYSKREFSKTPQAFVADMNELRKGLIQLKTLRDPLPIAQARQHLYASFYFAGQQMAANQRPKAIDIMNRYLVVLASDRSNHLLLTDHDVNGIVRYWSFLGEMQGKPPLTLTKTVLDKAARQLASTFNSLDLTQKKILCSGQVIWQVVQSNWESMSPSRKQELKRSLSAQLPAPSSAGRTYTSNRNPQADAMALEMEMRFQQQSMEMMNQMSEQHHVSTLNMIENMGNTQGYWELGY